MADILVVVFYIVLISLAFIAALYLYYSMGLKKLKRRYKPEDDKSKQGESRREFAKREPFSKATYKSEGRGLLPTTSSFDDGKTSSSNGVSSKPISRGSKFLKRIRKRGWS